MSDEKRFTKKKTVIEVSVFVAVCVLAGVLGIGFVSVSNNYADLSVDYDNLLLDYQILTGDYDTLFDDYNTLETVYNSICNTIKQSILPVQYSLFAEAVRRYYMPIYLDGSTPKERYMGYAEFCRNIILHDSYQYNAFSEVSDAFSDALRYGSDTMNLTWSTLYCFDPWYDFWHYLYLTGDELIDINNIVQWCINEIDYEYDSKITFCQDDSTWDYPKFPVETMFRTMGDCEDQAILTATYLETCGFETAISIYHDPDHPTLGEFNHAALLVHIEDTDAFYSMYPSGILWRFSSEMDPYYPPDFTWCVLDTTWNVPFGSTPSWLQDYQDFGGMTEYTVSDAICDINGGID